MRILAKFRHKMAGLSQTVKILLDVGADPNAVDINGQTALHMCMPCGYTGCVSSFSLQLESGMQDIDARHK